MSFTPRTGTKAQSTSFTQSHPKGGQEHRPEGLGPQPPQLDREEAARRHPRKANCPLEAGRLPGGLLGTPRSSCGKQKLLVRAHLQP